MTDTILWEGHQSLVPPGAHPQLGDAPLTFSLPLPPTDAWRESSWLCLDCRVNQASQARTAILFDTKDGRQVQVDYALIPNVWVHFRVQLDELWNRRNFLPVFPGSYKGHFSGLPTDPRDIVRITFQVTPGLEFENAEITKIYLSDHQPPAVRPEKPIVDEMGQMIGREWSTKTHSFSEMETRLKAEYARSREPAQGMPGRSRFGGFTDKKFDATGYFRTQHDGKRWWLVDPEGYAFFSHGMCYGTRMGEFGWYTGLEGFYAAAPSPEDPRFRPAFTHPGLIPEYAKRHGVTERSNEWMYNPARGNMIRVFGENWWEAWRSINCRRFRDWGINTLGVGIANFEDERVEDFLRLAKIPYAVTLKRFPVTERFIFRDFPDVFDPAYEKNSEAFARNELRPLAEDPYLMGYFMHNEPEWLFEESINIAWELLVRPEPLHSRSHLAAWLEKRYGTADNLSRAWGVDIPHFERLLKPLPRNTLLSAQGRADLEEYEKILIDAFAEIPARACRKAAPHHLNMGLRCGRIREKMLPCCRHFDIVSFNCYSRHPQERMDLGRRAGKPMIIGEWHFGAPDCGLPRTALIAAVSQEERAKAYRYYLEAVASDPDMVGAHYFEYNNQTIMGRFDGENMALGIIDCTNLPYPHMAKAIRETSLRLYGVMRGDTAPFDEPVAYMDPAW